MGSVPRKPGRLRSLGAGFAQQSASARGRRTARKAEQQARRQLRLWMRERRLAEWRVAHRKRLEERERRLAEWRVAHGKRLAARRRRVEEARRRRVTGHQAMLARRAQRQAIR